MVLTLVSACVMLINVYAVLLIVLRARVYGVSLYRPMIVNVGLSCVPVLVALVAVGGLLFLPLLPNGLPAGVSTVLLWTYLIVATSVWLLFFPNAIYLITELNFSHRDKDDPVPLWYDIVQTLTLTISGIANGVLSLGVIQVGFIALLTDPAKVGIAVPPSSWVLAGFVIVLGAVGVYLGRYLRFNSWDVRHPSSMLGKLRAHFVSRGRALEAGAFIVSHAVLIALVYVPVFALAWATFGAES